MDIIITKCNILRNFNYPGFHINITYYFFIVFI